MKRSDLALGALLLSVILFFIIPMPPVLLDMMMALNLALSMVILFTAVFSKEALDMSSFPTILLLMTIFRISLNVSSTRMILLEGKAGNVVDTFGAFVGGALAGFIGTHAEGSMGMLEIFPEYRRRGLGCALEAGLIRRLLERGEIPFCQVIEGNEASMRLQEKLGMTFSDEPVYWMVER